MLWLGGLWLLFAILYAFMAHWAGADAGPCRAADFSLSNIVRPFYAVTLRPVEEDTLR